MKKLIFTIIFFFAIFSDTYPQEIQDEKFVEGKITYISNRNIYAQFESTEGIEVGDTLFIKKKDEFFPAIKVQFLSSRSAAGSRIDVSVFKIGDALFAKISRQTKQIPVNDSIYVRTSIMQRENDEFFKKGNSTKKKLKGRTTIQSISSFSNLGSDKNLHSSRATVNMNYDDVDENSFTGNFYGSFVNNPSATKKNNLKIYDFNGSYNIDSLSTLTLGRFINTQLNAAGTVDGISYERKFNNLDAGIFLGSRPASTDYGFDFNLFQTGVFVSMKDSIFNNDSKTSIALINQTNNFKTDRRFFSLQHNNNFIPNSFFYFLTEADLYENALAKKGTTFRLTGLHTTIRTNFSKTISASASYDARKNIFYYESFKTYLDSNYTDQTRHTFRLGITMRLTNLLFINLNSSYGKRTGENNSATNYYAMVSYSNIPLINVSASASLNLMKNIYSNSTIGGVRIYRDFLAGLISTALNFRRVNYKFSFSSGEINQNIFNTDVSVRLPLELFLSVNYEGIFQASTTYNRLFLDLTRRF